MNDELRGLVDWMRQRSDEEGRDGEEVEAAIYRECAGKLEAALSVAQGQGWLPIESAPRDELILVGPTKRMGICAAMNHSRDGWVTETCSEWFNIYTPTHWQPLPAAPAQPDGVE